MSTISMVSLGLVYVLPFFAAYLINRLRNKQDSTNFYRVLWLTSFIPMVFCHLGFGWSDHEVLPLFIMNLFSFVMIGHQGRKTKSILKTVSEQTGLTYSPNTELQKGAFTASAFGTFQPPSLHGEFNASPIDLELTQDSNTSRWIVRVTTHFDANLEAGLELRSKGKRKRSDNASGSRGILLGDSDFDERFQLAGDEEKVFKLFNAESRRVLSEADERVSLHVNDAKLTTERYGVPTSPKEVMELLMLHTELKTKLSKRIAQVLAYPSSHQGTEKLIKPQQNSLTMQQESKSHYADEIGSEMSIEEAAQAVIHSK